MMRERRNSCRTSSGGIGGHVEILGRLGQQQVAHSAADEISLVSGLGQGFAGFQCAIIDLVTADPVCGQWQDLCPGGVGARLAAEHFVDDATNHEGREGGGILAKS